MTAELVILRDDREQAPLRFGDVPVETVRLPAGDYSARGLTEHVALERKRIGELATCCGTDRERFLEQVERLRAYPVRALIIEGNIGDVTCGAYRSRIKPQSVVGTLVKLLVDWQIAPLFCGDANDAAMVVLSILRRVHRQHIEAAA